MAAIQSTVADYVKAISRIGWPFREYEGEARVPPFVKWGTRILAFLAAVCGTICRLASPDKRKSSPTKDAASGPTPHQQ